MNILSDEQKTETLIKITQDLIKFDTQNPPNNTKACVEYISNLLLEHDIKYSILKDSENRNHLFTEMLCNRNTKNDNPNSISSSCKSILFVNHIDTPNLSFIKDPLESPLNYDWKYPFNSGMVINNSVYGLGAFYSKSCVAAQLFTLIEMKKFEVDLKSINAKNTTSTENKDVIRIKLLCLSNGIAEYHRLRKDAHLLISLKQLMSDNSLLLKSDYTITPFGGFELPDIKGLVEKNKHQILPMFGNKSIDSKKDTQNNPTNDKSINDRLFTISIGNKGRFDTQINFASNNVSSVNFMETDNLIHLLSVFLNIIKNNHYKIEIRDSFKEFIRILPANQVIKSLLTSKLLANAMRNPNSSLYCIRTLCSPTVSPISVNSNINPTQLDSSTTNYIEADLDIRLLPGSILQDAENLIVQLIKDGQLTSKMRHKIVSYQIGNETQIDSRLYRSIQKVMRGKFNSEIIPVLNPYLDYSMFFREIGSQTLGFCPRINDRNGNFDLFGKEKNITNEQVSIHNLLFQADFYLNLLTENFLVD
jgi:acetylornithine deacetylase/succinyl-diaminopimelate desuccinylase-like protein